MRYEMDSDANTSSLELFVNGVLQTTYGYQDGVFTLSDLP